MTQRVASVEHYDRNAPHFGARYSVPQFEDVHREILAFLPPPGAAVLDVGAGSGRDAAALARRGYAVTAVEPSTELQAWSRRHYGPNTVDWITDQLPRLATVRASARKYDFILCSAVLMHVKPTDIGESFEAFADLLKSNGNLAVSLRARQAKDPIDIFYDLPDTALFDAANAVGLILIKSGGSADHLGRRDVLWRSFLFCKPERITGGSSAMP